MTADAIRERILRGRYPEGEPLRQDAIGAELGVSRIPVREALRQLEAEGLVTFNPHRGAVVSTLSLKQIQELFELRAEIEGDLIRRAVPHMTAEDHARAVGDPRRVRGRAARAARSRCGARSIGSFTRRSTRRPIASSR